MTLSVPRSTSIDFSPARLQLAKRKLELTAQQVTTAPRTTGHKEWPPDYALVKAWRSKKLAEFERDPKTIAVAKAYYRDHPADFINDWCDTYDPRNEFTPGKDTFFPLIMFPRQQQLVEFIVGCLTSQSPGLIEKSRDMGATWIACCISVWLFLFHGGSSVGWGSQKAEYVDELGNPKSIFEKMRILLRRVPKEFLPDGFGERYMVLRRIRNPLTGSVIGGDVGDNIGRGDRTAIYFKDESAWYEHPELIEASLSNTTRVPIDISSVSGLGTLFHRKREAGIIWEPGQEFHKYKVNVFIMDWRDHPDKNQEWYDGISQYHQDQGTPHVLAREVDRDYAGAAEGRIVEPEWVRAAVDAHLHIEGLDDSGTFTGGLDIADGGGDRNALALRKGRVLISAQEWGERDTGVTARRAIKTCQENLPIELQYDSCGGYGASVKAEFNRLSTDLGLLPKDLKVVPWNAAAKVLEPGARSVPGDPNSILNKDSFENLKAQAWFEVSRKFYRTWRARTDPDYKFDPNDLISIRSDIPLLRQIEKELCQATMTMSPKTNKLVVDKSPDGTRSPNVADAIVMCYFPWRGFQSTTSYELPRIIHGD